MVKEVLPLSRNRDRSLTRLKAQPDRRKRPFLSVETQISRIGPTFDRRLADIIDRDDIELADDPSALAPERALVLEVIGSPDVFVNAAKKIGLEWLAEDVTTLKGVSSYFSPSVEDDRETEDYEPDDDQTVVEDGLTDQDFDFLLSDDPEQVDETGGALYLGMPTKATFDSLRKLWETYKEHKPAPDGFGDWWKLFGLLHDIRPWGPRDRIRDAVLQRLQEERLRQDGGDLQLEIDLWYRGDAEQRARAFSELQSAVREVGGEILDELRLDEIRYHAALLHLPGAAVDEIVSRNGPLALDDDIMSIRPQSGFRFTIDEFVSSEADEIEDAEDSPHRASIVALIDGWPVQNHVKLRNRLDVIELDVANSMAPVNTRFHGSAMASLILRGDLHEENPPLDRRLKVVPVLMPDGAYETPPRNKLALGVILRAVTDLKEGTGGYEPSGPDVIIINHSICDEAAGFAGVMSPWARLLDFLAWKYRVLFVVSAGNIPDPFNVPSFATGAEMRAAKPEHRRAELLRSIDAAKSQRTIFAPAESVNALTVGAAHSDGSMLTLPNSIADPFGDRAVPIIGSGLGHGFNRSVKPDVLLPGGRQIALATEGPILRVHGREHADRFGQQVATPDPYTGHLDFVRKSAGTSNATALATRTGLLIADMLDDSPINVDIPWYKRDTAPCVLKALIAHGASWGDLGHEMTDIHSPAGSSSRRKEAVSRAMGYGPVDGRLVDGGSHRVTLLGEDRIRKDQRHEWRIPLPDDLRSSAEFRRIVVTLAWLTPVLANSSQYRAIGLNMVGADGKTRIWEGVKRHGAQPGFGFAKRGTLIHAVYEGNKKAIPFGPEGDFVINVQATAKAAGLSKIEVPYALAVSIEVADNINADIATSIRNRMMLQTRVR